MYVLIVLPQRRRQSAHRRMVSGIAPGDEIVTSGGIYGFVRGIGDDDLTLEIAEGTNVRVSKRAVAFVVEPRENPAAEGENTPKAEAEKLPEQASDG